MTEAWQVPHYVAVSLFLGGEISFAVMFFTGIAGLWTAATSTIVLLVCAASSAMLVGLIGELQLQSFEKAEAMQRMRP